MTSHLMSSRGRRGRGYGRRGGVGRGVLRVLCTPMTSQSRGLSKRLMTPLHRTHIRSLPCVHSNMGLEIIQPHKSLIAIRHRAHVRLLARVDEAVTREVSGKGEGSPALLTHVGTLARVLLLVLG